MKKLRIFHLKNKILIHQKLNKMRLKNNKYKYKYKIFKLMNILY